MKPLIHKAFAYITYQSKLLIFRHVGDPESGLQVPAGTIKPGEHPDMAALREAEEETGLQGLVLASYLGEQVRDMADYGKDEIHHRYFYHLLCAGLPLATWRHEEPDASEMQGDKPLFEFFWVALPDGVPQLIADHDILLSALIERFRRL
jgi:8-oxo-dGTP pyrophosphatase MutT (NUDIX family)